MADVRSMLRLEREKRKISHPHASYTTDGKLLCNLCETVVKSETAWQSHLHSTQHSLRLSRARDAVAARGADGGNKKRKASDLDSPAPEERKKPKPTTPSSPLGNHGEAEDATTGNDPAITDVEDEAQPIPPPREAEEAVDVAQLAAFDRELADMEAAMQASSARNAAPTISAAPMTAAEVAAQAREEQSAQRGRREAELEDEKEDAARLLEDEFEQMETLEERVRKLRERREALRENNGTVSDSVQSSDAVVSGYTQMPARTDQPKTEAAAEVGGDGESDDGDDDDDDDDDSWNFGSR